MLAPNKPERVRDDVGFGGKAGKGGMASTLTWLDFSDRDRKRTLDAIDLFREEDTRDELGLGVIRDAFADRLFPGTSTIQTRVRYFIFVPWLFHLLKPADREAERFAQRKAAPGILYGGPQCRRRKGGPA